MSNERFGGKLLELLQLFINSPTVQLYLVITLVYF
jgi:hypothetical protein